MWNRCETFVTRCQTRLKVVGFGVELWNTLTDSWPVPALCAIVPITLSIHRQPTWGTPRPAPARSNLRVESCFLRQSGDKPCRWTVEPSFDLGEDGQRRSKMVKDGQRWSKVQKSSQTNLGRKELDHLNHHYDHHFVHDHVIIQHHHRDRNCKHYHPGMRNAKRMPWTSVPDSSFVFHQFKSFTFTCIHLPVHSSVHVPCFPQNALQVGRTAARWMATTTIASLLHR